MGPYILLAVVIVCFLGAGIFALVRWLVGRRKWLWPAGERVTAQFGTFTAHFVCTDSSPALPLPILAKRAAMGAHCLEIARTTYTGVAVPREFAVRLVGDETYTRIYDAFYHTKSAGMLLEVERAAGDETMPLVVCKASKFHSTPLTGSLVIHELGHFIFPLNREHTDPQVPQLEKEAQQLFEDLLARGQ